ncbi:beta-glucosidase BglX [Desemzia sp. RIT804]|uniref:beta-glucosidase BglX n=1 Tax=Desemzia sp. RIT 804 TaxID=2810209 RepID=UPI00194FCA21|nr:beta-glucosidase BglX [Desemzia sp. RIT 804]MBM6615162.1 beta-glucosidase BglX [Desemzia sp. RIT 804]
MKEQQLKELMTVMTLEDKIFQLLQLLGSFYQDTPDLVTGPKAKLGINDDAIKNAGSILNVRGADKIKAIQKSYLENSHSKIPLLFMADIINGFETIFPVPIGLGATWNPEIVKKSAAIAAKEAAVSGVHITFSPMVDLVRDPRWGRVMESTGEDAYLNSAFAKAFVQGYQGTNELLTEDNIVACVKHFAAYGAPEGGREYNTVDMSERTLREYYLPAYKAALEAGAKMVMTSFNVVDGVPATGNKWLNRDILRNEWDFNGILISDYAAIKELIDHGVAEDENAAAKMALEAGVDIDMMTSIYANHLLDVINKFPEIEDDLNESVYRVLQLKNELGLFEDPYRSANSLKEKELHLSTEHRQTAREVVSESLVLLKNDNQVLPLKSNQTIALIGPYADSTSLSGSWSFSSNQESTVTLKKAFEEYLDEENLFIATGSKVVETEFLESSLGNYFSPEIDMQIDEEKELKKAVEVAEKADVLVIAVGEHYLQSGEGGSRANIIIPQVQKNLIQALAKLGKPMVGVIFSGRPLDLREEVSQFDGLVQAWFPGTEGGHGIADILFGTANPSGRLSMSFPYDVGQIPVHYNEFSTGRPYQQSNHSKRYTSKYVDIPNKPLFPFGYGLSYTDFSYTNFELNKEILTQEDRLTASIDITNKGTVKGKETVQLYIHDNIGSVTRPIKELKGFKQVELEPNETITVTFEIEEKILRFYNRDMEFISEPGEFEVMIGPNSEINEKKIFYLKDK